METNPLIRIGLKNNSLFLFKETLGNNQGGIGNHPKKAKGDIHHNAIIYLTDEQFISFKKLITKHGFSVEKSLSRTMNLAKCDYSCFLI